ncbi:MULTISPECIES: 2-iminoacetate synthase ThiH [Megasphaera]|jgi:2-iminoacetate synthase|uniref:2-iminoacetate synthase ThiH n=2 Tax=Megasphaera TaxID=906 RepID=A0ABV1CUP5_9FIRM|nr:MULTISPECIES: 2-iminoacetate synthase ThiH [unclassified Megasphaera]MCH3902129.1 2-iminoacetate synthase ThiH [Limosilactobacillus oris]MCI1888130.1 2-iminoacetate synthase ThiH [Sporolactobacillus sp.]MCI1905986.1 2-iminoacetate synthase ThiH [Enterococcaceae bacterium]EPP17803.1 thiamine biosynthesis protein ThiH [Megasphaera sp. BL7]EPP18053.1 thiamine biosynthesis protein ThiH [Megasphaera sp. NM10]
MTEETKTIDQSKLIDHMKYLPGMEVIDSDMLDQVVAIRNSFNNDDFTDKDVRLALSKEHLDPRDFMALLSTAAAPFLEEMAQKAHLVTRRHFGNNITILTPIYFANYCDNYCIYCGFNSHNKIKRARLTDEELHRECKNIADTGIEEVIMLTGESPKMSDIKYIGNAVKIASQYFRVINMEIYPVNSEDYKYLHECGADYVTVFQETYNSDKYATLHLAGHKRIFPYRFYSQERAILGGMRGVGFAALLGLDDYQKDALATGMHAWLMQRKYPHAEISLSCPRLCPIINNDKINPKDVDERKLTQIICAYRLFMPYACIVVSSRESARYRNAIMKIAATKVSASVCVGIGGHLENDGSEMGDEQFEITDGRSFDQMYSDIKGMGLQPVTSEYIYL